MLGIVSPNSETIPGLKHHALPHRAMARTEIKGIPSDGIPHLPSPCRIDDVSPLPLSRRREFDVEPPPASQLFLRLGE